MASMVKEEMGEDKSALNPSCILCGVEIKAPKGIRRGELSIEQQRGVHNGCYQKQQEILNRYNVSIGAYYIAVLEGLKLMHPDVEWSEPVKDFHKREAEVEEEIKKAFPKNE